MAVIITDMDMPVNCWQCDLNNSHFCDITSNSIEDFLNDEEREKECPLKSTDEMIAEIDTLQFIHTELEYNGAIKKVISKDDVLDIINKYCKENTDEN